MAAWETEQWRAAWQTARRGCERHRRHDEQTESDGAAAAGGEPEGGSESSSVVGYGRGMTDSGGIGRRTWAAWETEQWRAAWQMAQRRCERRGRHDDQTENGGAAAAEDETEGSSESGGVVGYGRGMTDGGGIGRRTWAAWETGRAEDGRADGSGGVSNMENRTDGRRVTERQRRETKRRSAARAVASLGAVEARRMAAGAVDGHEQHGKQDRRGAAGRTAAEV